METEIELTIGKVYRLHHQRKGVFVAQLIDVEDTPEGDEQDDVFLKMKYDVRAGTDQVGLAIAPGKDKVRVSNLRPSLIVKIEEHEGDSWLREVQVPEQVVPEQQQPGIMERLRKTLGGE